MGVAVERAVGGPARSAAGPGRARSPPATARRRRRRRVRVARRRAGRRVQQRGAVAHRAGQRVLVDQALERRDRRRAPSSCAPRVGLRPITPQARRGHADRARPVAAGRGRHQPGGDGGRRPAARAARRAVRRARVDRRPEQHRLGRAVVAPLRRVRLAGDEQPGGQVALRRRPRSRPTRGRAAPPSPSARACPRAPRRGP